MTINNSPFRFPDGSLKPIAGGAPLPEAPDQLEEFLNDPHRLAGLVDARGQLVPEKLQEFVRDYTKNVYERDPSLKAQLKDAVAEGLKDFATRNSTDPKQLQPMLQMGDGTLPTKAGALEEAYKILGLKAQDKRQIAATGRGPGAALAGEYEHFSDFLQTIAKKQVGDASLPKVLNDMSSLIGADGGFGVPEEYRAELMYMSLESAVVRPRARVIPMNSQTLRIPAIRDASHASSVFGGISASWFAEMADLSSSSNQPSFTQIQLLARKLSGYTVATNELVNDNAISLESLIMQLFSAAIAYFEDDAFINGTGAGQPLGVLNANAMVSVSGETGQAAATIVYQNIVKMFSRMLPSSLNRAVWVCHPDTFQQLAQMALSVGTGGAPVWIVNIQGNAPATIFGRPIVVSEKCQATGTAGDLMFIDFLYYLLGDRQALQIASSPHVKFTTDETVWRFTQRVDGRPWLQTALTPRNGSNTLSPFVSLATRS